MKMLLCLLAVSLAIVGCTRHEGRFAIVAGKKNDASNNDVPVMMKIDTETGESWELADMMDPRDPDGKRIVTFWSHISTAEELRAQMGLQSKAKP